jgi:hypothetical protein
MWVGDDDADGVNTIAGVNNNETNVPEYKSSGSKDTAPNYEGSNKVDNTTKEDGSEESWDKEHEREEAVHPPIKAMNDRDGEAQAPINSPSRIIVNKGEHSIAGVDKVDRFKGVDEHSIVNNRMAEKAPPSITGVAAKVGRNQLAQLMCSHEMHCDMALLNVIVPSHLKGVPWRTVLVNIPSHLKGVPWHTALLNIIPLHLKGVPWYSLSERLLVPGSCANLAVVIGEAPGDPDAAALMDLHPEYLNAAPFSQFVPPCGACWATGVCWGILTADRQASLKGSIASEEVHVSRNDYVAVGVG